MPAPRRVLFTIPNLDTAGSGAAMIALADGLDRSRYAPTVCVAERRATPLEATAAEAGLELVEASVTVPGRPRWRLAPRIRRAGRAAPADFDLWHSFHYLDDYTEPLIARRAGCRRWLYTKKNMSWGGRGWRLRTRLASAVAAQNPSMVEDFFAGAHRPVRVIPPAVDGEHFHPGPSAPERQRFGLPADGVVVGHVAHLLPNKNQADLVRALAVTGPEVHLALVGQPRDDAYAREVRTLVGQLGVEDRVTWIGGLDDVAPLLRACNVFAFASVDEAAPVAVLEAMSTGLPVVTTDIPGTRHLVTDGVEGRRVPPGDAGALARAIDDLARDPDLRRRLGHQARETATTRFTPAVEATAYQSLYDEVLAR